MTGEGMMVRDEQILEASAKREGREPKVLSRLARRKEFRKLAWTRK